MAHYGVMSSAILRKFTKSKAVMHLRHIRPKSQCFGVWGAISVTGSILRTLILRAFSSDRISQEQPVFVGVPSLSPVSALGWWYAVASGAPNIKAKVHIIILILGCLYICKPASWCVTKASLYTSHSCVTLFWWVLEEKEHLDLIKMTMERMKNIFWNILSNVHSTIQIYLLIGWRWWFSVAFRWSSYSSGWEQSK